ncbi:peptidase domain-containing ABC transporter [Solimonas sp. K1W22B-7]|uniref:peptidase domain-containing ABC transporter n=1 Tax=Solimonas sp. K1W22B-7 TaxID=2303331 RepID=UPI000E334ACE|nr:peptidase domain-containing ABC transporter [Solimonas sp. K1W22B-7]AXQ27463.1 peptidase domain-containing ABC transporter [Solimonas sp. K1W22B-7]
MLDALSFGFGRKLPLILQTEAAECGLACLGMVAGYHGLRTDLQTLRQRYSVSLKGARLSGMMQVADGLGLSSRAVKLDLEDIPQLRLPCILHWNFNHFVVLQKVSGRSVTICDPAMGIRRLSLDEVSDSFTGVALELWPGANFVRAEARQKISLRQLTGDIVGLYRALGQALVLALVLEVFFIVGPFLLQWVADEVLVSADRNLLNILAIGFGLMLLMQQFVVLVRGWVLMVLSTSLKLQWNANAFTHLLRLPAHYFEKRHLGDVVSRFGSIDAIQRTLTTSFLEAVLDGLMAAATLLLMFLYSPMLCLVAVVAMGLYALGRWLWFSPLRMATEEQIVHAAKQESHFLETMRGIRTIKLFQRQEERRSRWLGLMVEQVNAELRSNRITLLYQALNGLLFGAEHILVIWLGAQLVMEQSFTIGMLLAFIAYKTQFDNRVSSLIDKLIELRMLRLQGERLADILLTPAESTRGLAADGGREQELEPSIEVRDLRLRYAEQDPYVLDGISFHIAPGENVAIVGPSGSGKTSLLNVLLGLMPPSEGQVLVGGRGIDQVGLDALRRMTGSVLQDDALFAGSIADNICFFDDKPDRDWVEACARIAAIADDIDAMPMAYNTMIGDMGAALSGGQKQRVLLARALYKRPKILVLDEATSHLDVAREQQVNDAIRALRITRIIVAHRPQTIASADRVIELAEGKIAVAAPLAATGS